MRSAVRHSCAGTAGAPTVATTTLRCRPALRRLAAFALPRRASPQWHGICGGQVTVLERTRECGKKILMSGGSRCNVLPKQSILDLDFFSESSKSALRAVFASWSLGDVKLWLESTDGGVGLRLGLEEETNKYFPLSNSSKEVRDNLVAACEQSGVHFKYNASVEDISSLPGGGWRCELPQKERLEFDRLVVSTGGLSFPKVGTDGTGHRFLKASGHSLGKGIYPALTPLTAPHPGGANLAGVSLYSVGLECVEADMGTKKKRKKKRGAEAIRTGLLFTHKGYSGPSILDLSHRTVQALERGEPLPALQVNWTGEDAAVWEERLAKGGPGLVLNVLKKHLPQRLAEALYAEAGVGAGRKLSELRKEERLALLGLLSRYRIPITGHQGYAKAEVTGGGVPLREINCATMESKVLPGVYLCGEICDVFGRIGGFNFYWAWVSGRLAGLGAAGDSATKIEA
eukprot:jgi/Tetstr1/442941/TSEL_031003.t1